MLGVLIAALFLAPPTEAQKKEAKGHFEQGRSFYDAGAYDDALREYQAAYKLMPAPQFLFNIAQCFRLKGDKQNAIDYYQKFLDKAPDSPVADEARDYIAKLKLQLELEAAESARKKAEQEAAEARKRAKEEEERRAAAEKMRQRSGAEEEEAIRRAQLKIEEDRQRKQAEENKERDRRMEEAHGAGRVTRIVGLSMMGAALITGLVTVLEIKKLNDASSLIDNFNNNNCSGGPPPGGTCPWTTELDQAVMDHDNDGTAKVMLGMTIGLLVTGTVVYFIGRGIRSGAEEDARNWRPSASVVPTVGPHEAGLSLGFRF
jgi:tetratricopeptide (TPR) repeat protein